MASSKKKENSLRNISYMYNQPSSVFRKKDSKPSGGSGLSCAQGKILLVPLTSYLLQNLGVKFLQNFYSLTKLFFCLLINE